ncbi:primosomal replication protein PriB/PriC domain protein, partial [Salmonella enterica]|nr:primosomal replication protein PriB/PriC domain protein [Salmonella enterica]EBN5091864.1 primosomal replication protein PriB/PriC domain protein [Salmonella enterica]EBN5091866.1 primosomal replication protein PriB/PriC domain protein [Salmonella enterica]ECP5785020.1 primosomal replication protein PriB/PriC domain protein [Salmonella enterica]ECP5785203.1 primosomal replication protein PriB/PriC domain protein [Salmonella enterica]
MTRTELQELYNAYLEAELAVLKGKSIMLNGQSMTME